MKLVHYNIVIKIRGSLCGKILGIERLNGNKQMVDALRLIIAYEQLTEVGILQHRSKGIQTLSQNFFPVSNEEQPMGLSGILLAKPFIIQRRNHRLARTGGSYHQVAGISPDGPLCLQLIQNFLLVGVWRDIHGIDCSVVGVKVFLRFQCPSQPFLLALRVVLKLACIPITFKGCRNLVDGLRQISAGDLYIPFQTTRDGCVGQIGGAHIGSGKTRVSVKDVGLCVKSCALGIIADLNPGIRQSTQFLNGL